MCVCVCVCVCVNSTISGVVMVHMLPYRHSMDVEEVMIDPSTNWKPVEKPKEIKEEEGIKVTMLIFYEAQV